MDTPRPCGCKGRRTCLLCEKEFKIAFPGPELNREHSYVYCPLCNMAWPGWDGADYLIHPNHKGDPIEYPGVAIFLDFLTGEEELELLNGIDNMPWDLSQSGRRKQNFGPKCNFKKQRLRVGDFNGFPLFTKFVQDKFKEIDILRDFQTIEQCSLEYNPKRGASIDPHVDDCWIWGERIVTVNLLADSVLTMTLNDQLSRYNLSCVKNYPAVVDNESLHMNGGCYNVGQFDDKSCYPVVRIPMPRRSLIVLFNSARYDWEHQVLREDVDKRRVCLAYREFTPPYLAYGKKAGEGAPVLAKAREFF